MFGVIYMRDTAFVHLTNACPILNAFMFILTTSQVYRPIMYAHQMEL